ncbi:MAG TPA: cytochrome c maturation protein CcmE, partial [Fimbriimonadaceae bacterium]|nr:cytochrome c maturation protein CcmE [Fimbriimonadaceae bacterium]
MKLGLIFSIVIGFLAVGLGGYTFLTSASPYVSARQTLADPGRQVHVVGHVIHSSVQLKLQEGVLEFDIKDDLGDTLRIVYKGSKPANFESAQKVSVAGQSD